MTCLGNGTGTDNCGPSYLLFNGSSDLVNLGSVAAIDDLPAGDFTVDFWVRCDGLGGGGSGKVISKLVAATGWHIYVAAGTGRLRAFADFTGVDAQTESSFALNDSTWHHIAVTWDSATNTFDIFLDGVSAIGAPTAGTLVYNADAANTLYVGNSSLGNEGFDGLIGWLRISNNQRWTADFTAPARCTLPAVDANTLVLEIYEGAGATTYNLAVDSSHGAITGALWGCSCAIENDPTCDNAIYVANKHNMANITDVYWYDASAALFSANLQNQALPQILYPPVPAQNDIVYFGIDSTLLNSGPFASLVFDIGTAQVDLNTLVWQYWNGAWVNLTVQDNTNASGAMTGEAFDTTGVNSVHWEQPSDWATTTVNGVTGYWVRVLINAAVGANPAPPIQQNRHIYSVTWPYVQVDDSDLGGDLPLHLKIAVENPTDGNITSHVERVLISSRSSSRGTDFSPFINFSDEQNHTGITVTAVGGAAFANYVGSPTGRVLQDPGPFPLAQIASIVIDETVSTQYRGRFRLFVRSLGNATPNDYGLQLIVRFSSRTVFQSDVIDVQTGSPYIWDFGQFVIPANYGADQVFDNIEFQFYAVDRVGGLSIQHFDMVLWPVDEWAGDFFTSYLDGAEAAAHSGTVGVDLFSNTTRLDVDSLGNPKRNIQALVNQIVSGETNVIYTPVSNDRAQLGIANEARLYFMTMSYNSTYYPEWSFDYKQTSRIQIYKVQRYLSMRGDR